MRRLSRRSSAPRRSNCAFHFSIADRGARAENGVIDTFLRILELAGSRFTASSVVRSSSRVALQRRFDLAESDLESFAPGSRKPASAGGSTPRNVAAHWACPSLGKIAGAPGSIGSCSATPRPRAKTRSLFEGILAYDNVEGSLAETLGHFAEFAEALFATARRLGTCRAACSIGRKRCAKSRSVSFPRMTSANRSCASLRRIIESLGETAPAFRVSTKRSRSKCCSLISTRR